MQPQYRAYIDESGGIDTEHFVLGGYAGPVQMWNGFVEDWQRVLDGPPAWPPFHAVACESGRGGFEVLCERERKSRLGQLVSVLARHRPVAVLAVMDVRRFMDTMPAVEPARNAQNQLWKHHPYSFCAAHMFGNLATLPESVGWKPGKVEVVFDALGKRFEGSARNEIERGVLHAFQEDEPELARRLSMPKWASSEDSEDSVPLQAADLLVWHIRRRWDEPDGMHRRALRELKRATSIRFCRAAPGIDLQEAWANTLHPAPRAWAR